MKGKRIGIRAWLIASMCLAVLVPAVWVLAVRLEGKAPAVSADIEKNAVIGGREVSFRFADPHSGLRQASIVLALDGREAVLFREAFPSAGFPGGGQVREKVLALRIPPADQKMGDGKAVLRLEAIDFSWRGWFRGNRSYAEIPVTIDGTPPRIEVLSQAHNVNQGGGGVAVYRLSEACPRSGVHVGDAFFPGYAGYFQDPLVHIAFFALAHDLGKGTQIFLTATDSAGNDGRAGFYHHIRRKTFPGDKIVLSDGFLESKMPEFQRYFPAEAGAEPIALFLKVNRELRRENNASLTRITRTTDPQIHWEGPFLRLPNAARRAGFADKRDYYYRQEKIDHQVHLGIDLASLAYSPVPAANAGRVAFAGDLGIYGQTVVIDHGLGLFSLYSHLSGISAAEGRHVAKGEEIGRTGTTGLAGGDHLHFGMMIGPVFVNPIEWWDETWIQHNVTDKIALAGRALAPEEAAGVATGG